MDGHHYWLNMVRLRSNLILKYLNKPAENELKIKIESILGVNHKLNKMKEKGPVGVMPKRHNISVLLDAMNRLGNKISYDKYEEIFNQADLISLDNLNDFIKPLPGVEQFLINCCKNNIKVILLSNDTSERCQLALKTLKFNSYIKDAFGSEIVSGAKKDGDIAKHALIELDINPKKVINVGDHPNDILMGMNANICNNIGVLTGLSDTNSFLGLNCEIINNFNNLSFTNE